MPRTPASEYNGITEHLTAELVLAARRTVSAYRRSGLAELERAIDGLQALVGVDYAEPDQQPRPNGKDESR